MSDSAGNEQTEAELKKESGLNEENEIIVGIDLGTTYSEIAAYLDGRVQILGSGGAQMLPSVVGISPGGALLVGEAARNQHLLYPERTVRSIKRKMGSEERVTLGDRTFTPPEISALILRELVEWAARALGQPVSKAVITVPAYFSDAQRQATREAGALAGLEVVRILNEPTAASLAYGYSEQRRHTTMVYDLGGGTFDVSIVTIEGDVTEVLASHGNNHLGGDDFDQLLLEHLLAAFQKEHGIDLRQGHRVAYSRLWWAAEEAKKKLSFEPFVRVREEALATIDGKALHLNLELSREGYEEMIRPLVESTLESVAKAMADAKIKPADLDAVLLVGGATRTPMIARVLEERTGLAPRQEVHPDLCVALGAGILASRLAGREVERVLVDISPYSFGISYLGARGGYPYPYCYKPIIKRNTPLPATRTEEFFTAYPRQTAVEVNVYQGEDPDALKNLLVGNFRINGLTPVDTHNEVLCRMGLDLDGILNVTAIEKRTGKSAHILITQALQPKSEEELAEARRRLEALYEERAAELRQAFAELDEDALKEAEAGEWEESEAEPVEAEAEEEEEVEEGAEAGTGEPHPGVEVIAPEDPAWAQVMQEARDLLVRSRRLLGQIHEDDREEAIELNERIKNAIEEQDVDALAEAVGALKELLYFVEGRG